ncbi:MAG TPA: hypothetical protein VJ952_02340 [Opitutales bacterium]|nr:hypothetical protein [Opitutales bacterium]
MDRSFQHVGNLDLLETNPVAFFCSTRCDGDAVLKAYEWARLQCDLGTTVISGFHTPVEKDIYAILARRDAKLIHCYAKRLPLKRPSPEQHRLISEGRLLLIAPQECAQLPRPTKQSCALRNRFVAERAARITLANLHPTSALARDLKGFESKITT